MTSCHDAMVTLMVMDLELMLVELVLGFVVTFLVQALNFKSCNLVSYLLV